MTNTTQDNQAQPAQPTDKEINFAKQREMYERKLEEAHKARIAAEEKVANFSKQTAEDDDGDDEPYVDHKKLNKKLAKFGEQTKHETQNEIKSAVQQALTEERRNTWLNDNPDFNEVMSHAQKFADTHPKLAEKILKMPEGFERQQLVYDNIKAFGLHKKEEPKSSIQDKIDQNRRSPYYQPSGVGTAPFASAGNYSPSGQKDAYAKMQELKSRLRI